MIYLQLFWTFFKIGLFTFGGGYAMLPMIQAEVAAKGWLAGDELINFVAVSEVTPGPFAVNVSTYVGREVGGILGGFLATFGVVLPSFIIILLIAGCYQKFKKNRIVNGCMAGLHPVVVGLVGSAAVSVLGFVFPVTQLHEFISIASLKSLFVVVLAGVLMVKKVHPILIIVVCAACGIVFGYL